MQTRGMNMDRIRKGNEALILSLINSRGAMSRKDIAKAADLTPASVTMITGRMKEQGLLFESGVEEGSAGAGRRKILLDINKDYRHALSINIEPEGASIALTDLYGNAIGKKTLPMDTALSPEDFLQSLAKEAKKLIKKESADRLLGAEVGITGLVDPEKRRSLRAYGIWDREVAIADILEKELGLPVRVENNVNAFASAELLFGAGRFYDNLMLVKWGPGIGATVVIDGEIYEGRHGKAAELGHFIVDPNGKQCSCGRRGCLETVASYPALTEFCPFEMADFGKIYAQEKAKQSKAFKGFSSAMDQFARMLVNAVTILAPNRIVLYGPMFSDEEVRSDLIALVSRYDSSIRPDRFLFSSLSAREDYIGPAADLIRAEL